jgi:hypothetical protein
MTAGERAAAMAESVARAHARLLADHNLQFAFTSIAPSRPPSCLIALLKALGAAWPVLRIVFLIALAAVVLVGLVATGRALVRRMRRAGSGRRPGLTLEAGSTSLRPPASKTRALLARADQLAAEGRFDEAAHTLLHRTIEDVEARRPRAVRPALTSRDIAALEAIPAPARSLFSVIAARVERSFFGGRPLDAAGFAACRAAYADFASPKSWTAGAVG